MKDLIEALQILAKYTDTKWPTHCEHDVLTVNVEWGSVSKEDQERLESLGFSDGEDGFVQSTRFGSC